MHKTASMHGGEPVVTTSRAMLFTLLVVYILNFLDRQIVAILAEPMKLEFGLSDTQLGLLAGPAFAVFYAVLGVPIARYADRPSTNRVWLISVSLAVWSAMTAVCGLAQNFVQLALARVGVGVGEAGCTPAAHSLIADTVPPEKRSSAIAFYGLGIPIGGLLGLIIGGIVNDLYGWRTAFMLVGAPGVLLAFILPKLISDPRFSAHNRKAAGSDTHDASRVVGEGAAREIFASKAYLYIFIAASFTAFLSYGKGLWTISFFIRSHGFSTTEAGISMAVALGLSGVVGHGLAARWPTSLASATSAIC